MSDVGPEAIIAELHALRRFTGGAEEFWSTFLGHACRLAAARRVTLLARPEPAAGWVVSTTWPAGSPAPAADRMTRFVRVADDALAQGHTADATGGDAALIGIRLEAGDGDPPAVMVLEVASAPLDALGPSILLARFVADVPANYQKERALKQAAGDVVRFSEALDLMVLLNEDRRFIKAAMTLVNELATRHSCARVSLGWRHGDYLRARAISHVETFEARTSAVQALEASMEEALDQDEEIVWPRGNRAVVTRAHEEYARIAGSGSLLSVPLRLDGQPVGVVTCERGAEPFSEDDAAALRLMVDQAARRMGDLAKSDRWFGARLASNVHAAFSWLFGVRHTYWKLAGVALCAFVWFLAMGTWPYRLEGPFLLKTDDLQYQPAPFDGYIEDVRVQIGDAVKSGDLMLTLDARELLLEESAIAAEISRQSREAEKAQARMLLADMKIALAQKAQAEARLARVRYHLANARITAPMAGLVVEGDLKKMLGAPVRRGDILFKIARVDRMYAEIEVDERDVHEIKVGQAGEVAFVSRPQLSFPVVIESIDPAATPRDGRNEFLVRARLTGAPEPWWRPGMSGVAKLDAGPRNVAWILTHRTLEYLRLLFWW